MYHHLVFENSRMPFRHKEVFYRVCTDESHGTKYLPSGVESSSMLANSYAYAVIAVPYEMALVEFEDRARTTGRDDYCNALLESAKTLEREGKLAEAIAYLEDLISLQRESAQGHVLLAVCLAKENQTVQALKCAQKALALFRDRLTSGECEALGEVFLLLKQNDEARQCFILASERF
jgi:tetratricopeptide (TPR) repeat protein